MNESRMNGLTSDDLGTAEVLISLKGTLHTTGKEFQHTI